MRERLVDEELSIGDYVLTGGELPALVVTEAVTRLLPGVLGHEAAPAQDSFARGLLEHPQYTRPEAFREWTVPEILLSGDHGKIARWRQVMSLARTWQRRPDLLETADLSPQEQKWVDGLRQGRAAFRLYRLRRSDPWKRSGSWKQASSRRTAAASPPATPSRSR